MPSPSASSQPNNAYPACAFTAAEDVAFGATFAQLAQDAQASSLHPLREFTLLQELCALAVEHQEATPAQLGLLQRTFEYARAHHSGQLRKNGENYITHPTSVAIVLAPMRVDVPTLQAALLHDVLEDTQATEADMAKHFGAEVLKLVQGVTKLGRYKFSCKEEQQAENFRNMFLAMAEDVRVIMLKLADRLHNMRTLEFMKPEKQLKIAEETIEIFAPLANRIGMGNVKAELEDLALSYIDPTAYKAIGLALAQSQQEREQTMASIQHKLQQQLSEAGLQGRIYGRLKNYYSIYKKMQSQQKDLNSIFDISALRVIVESEPQCYEVLGLAHSAFTPVAGRFKDYIAMPKSNFYQSLHTTIIGPNSRPTEVQIRTQRMHEVAEYGIAAHFHYKEHGDAANAYQANAADDKLAWLKQILEMKHETQSAQEFVDNVKLELFPDQVFVFSPKGRVFSLPRGATPIDFAFRIHTEIGYQCAGSVVNEKMVPLDTELQNGDIVEVITNKKATPRLDWINLAKTQHAKGRIRQWYKRHYKAQHEQQGRHLLEAELNRAEVDRLMKSGKLLEVAKELNYQSVEDLLAAVGYGEMSLARVSNRVKKNQPAAQAVAQQQAVTEEKTLLAQGAIEALAPKQRQEALLSAKEGLNRKNQSFDDYQPLKGLAHKVAKCCLPVPGDAIVGVLTRSRGVMIHRDDCLNVLQANPERIMHLNWGGTLHMQPHLHQVTLEMQVMDRVGVLKDILIEVAEQNVNVANAKCQRDAVDHSVMVEIGVEVRHLEELDRLMERIKQLPDVLLVKRSNYRLNKGA